ncbi:MAG: AsnC family protein [Labilibaculum sp.]|nr:AsnC family protein [Labilibaculum sp.]MBI9058386.1 AsnC family protein [Labilibaculum sp.]
MEYKTMNRIELAAKLGISESTLRRRIKKLSPELQEKIYGQSLLFENQVKYIYEKVSDLNSKYE